MPSIYIEGIFCHLQNYCIILWKQRFCRNKDEGTVFPTASHDDQVDCLTAAIRHYNGNGYLFSYLL